MRTYLTVIDDSAEASAALRFAARRAMGTQGNVYILAVVPPQDFVAWGSVQATIEAEAREQAEELARAAAGAVFTQAGQMPKIMVRQGLPVEAVRAVLEEDASIAALVLGANPSGPPGPLVAYFAGNDCGKLPCPVIIVPGALGPEEIDRVS